LKTKIDRSRSKADIIREAEAMSERYQACIARQVDSINRLLGHQPNKDTTEARVFRYEHELMTLNEQLGLADVRQRELMDLVRRVRQHAVDTTNDRLLDILGGVGDEAYMAALPETIG
jgi:hypothetical protein